MSAVQWAVWLFAFIGAWFSLAVFTVGLVWAWFALGARIQPRIPEDIGWDETQ